MSKPLPKERVEEILEIRARKAAYTASQAKDQTSIASVAVVGIGPEQFGIPMEGLSFITRTPPIAHLPMMPPWIPGIVQIRNELIAAIDMKRWFGINARTSGNLLAVVEGQNGKLGLLIDAVLGFKNVTADDIAETLCHDSESTGHPIQATTKDLVAILNLQQLFNCREVTVDFRGAHEAPSEETSSSDVQPQKGKERSR